MDLKNRIGIFVFTLGVFMLLLRPFLIHQATSANSHKVNPAHVSSLLQRQIKKKDDNHNQVADVPVVRLFIEKISVRLISCLFSDNRSVATTYYTSWHQLVLHYCFQPGAP